MEKLVELLNEYEVYKGYNGGGWKITSMGLVYAKNIRDKGAIIILKSKEYGFIERLVQNDKIDLENYKDKSELYTLKVVHGTDYYIDLLTNKVNSDFLIMILSIQDNPIEYLCSILKE